MQPNLILTTIHKSIHLPNHNLIKKIVTMPIYEQEVRPEWIDWLAQGHKT